jgi:hypothetical protein
MKLSKLGAVAAFILTLQFLATLAVAALSWPKGSPFGISALNHLVDGIVIYIGAFAAKPAPFLLANLCNALLCAPAIVLTLALRERMPEARHRMLLAVIGASIAGALFLAGGIIPVVSLPQIIAANDLSAYRGVRGIVIGMMLAGTSAAGFALVLAGSAALSIGRLPRTLALLLVVGGMVEICEFAVPLILILDLILGVIWSLWLGVTLLISQEQLSGTDRPTHFL